MLSVLVGQEVEMFELVPKVRQRQCIVLETDRKSVPSRWSSMTERASSVCRQSKSWNIKLCIHECCRGLVEDLMMYADTHTRLQWMFSVLSIV